MEQKRLNVIQRECFYKFGVCKCSKFVKGVNVWTVHKMTGPNLMHVTPPEDTIINNNTPISYID